MALHKVIQAIAGQHSEDSNPSWQLGYVLSSFEMVEQCLRLGRPELALHEFDRLRKQAGVPYTGPSSP